jgi:hypothetical protein
LIKIVGRTAAAATRAVRVTLKKLVVVTSWDMANLGSWINSRLDVADLVPSASAGGKIVHLMTNRENVGPLTPDKPPARFSGFVGFELEQRYSNTNRELPMATGERG